MNYTIFMHVFLVEQDINGIWTPDFIGKATVNATIEYIQSLDKNDSVTWLFGGGHCTQQNGVSWSKIYSDYILKNFSDFLKERSINLISEEYFRQSPNNLALDTKGELKFLMDYTRLNSLTTPKDKIISITTKPHAERVKLLHKNLKIKSEVIVVEDLSSIDIWKDNQNLYEKFKRGERLKTNFIKYVDHNGSITESIAKLMDKLNVFKKF